MKTKETKGTNLPGAWIVNPKDRGRKPIKSGNIYLQNNEEFQIEIFNPLRECVLADIRLNSQSISKTGLVIKPGQRVYLDCFVDDRKKFIFQTYEIEMTDETGEAIQNNGLMEVFFYKEEAISLKNWSEKLRQVVIREYYPVYPYWQPYYRPYPVWYGGYCTTNIGTTLQGNSISFGGTTVNAVYNSTNNNSTLTSFNSTTGTLNLTGGVSNSASYTSGVELSNLNLNNSFSSNSIPIAGSLETGRIEKGEKSNQQFGEVDMDFEKNYIHHIVYQLLPESRKPKSASEIALDYKNNLTKKQKSGTSGNWPHQYDKNDDEVIDLIKKLSDLNKAGVLSDEEFNEKKKELLARI